MDSLSRRVYFSVATVLVFLWLGMVAWILGEMTPRVSVAPPPSSEGDSPGSRASFLSLNIPGIQFSTYRSAPGDTYSGLGLKFHLSERALRGLNRAGAGVEPKANTLLLIPSKDGIFHRVTPGQGLSDVAKLYGVSLREVLRVNRKRGDDELHPGDILYLPGAPASSAKETRGSSLEPAGAGRGFQKPTTGRFADGFGVRIHPLTGKKAFHAGLDLAPGWRARVMAAQDGKVTFAGIRAGFGRLVVLDHGTGLTSWYAHLDEILVKAQQVVKKGDLIGKVGKTGRVTGPHLHFEVRLNDKPQNPLLYLTQ